MGKLIWGRSARDLESKLTAELNELSAVHSLESSVTAETRPPGPHIIVFANEKGGVGKSTTAFHTCVALCNSGASVVAVDLDLGQKSLTRALQKRSEMAGHLQVEFESPKLGYLDQPNAGSLDELIRVQARDHDVVLIDVAGHDSSIARHAIMLANTLVTPINDSFMDIEVLGHFDPTNLEFRTLANFSRLVENSRTGPARVRKGALDWIVVQNRLRSLRTNNESKFSEAIRKLSEVAEFRLAPGLQERVIYRELVPFGLTLMDLDTIPQMDRPRSAAIAEMQAMLDSLNLPVTVSI